MAGPLAGCSILILADEPFTAYCLDILLKDAGADVQGTHSVREASVLLEQHRPSAVVLDTRSRTKADQQVRQRLLRLGIPCIVCSSDIGAERKAKGISVLPRPVRGTDLIEMLSGFKAAEGNAPPPTQPASARRSFGEVAVPVPIQPWDRSP
jgi:CheY-like chemotaxis protein